MIKLNIEWSNTVTEIDRPGFEFTKYIPFLILMGKLWDICCKHLENIDFVVVALLCIH